NAMSSAGAGGSASTPEDCAAICKLKVMEQHCPEDETEPLCVQQCSVSSVVCASETPAYIACLLNDNSRSVTFVCTDFGYSAPLTSICTTQYDAYLACTRAADGPAFWELP
ncbi:MAG TPA: hypothetical protein VNG33_11240, partial [Polyangiaceae bacterium]|nr:hypothetical protein [Polyangiaceae bacterium]